MRQSLRVWLGLLFGALLALSGVVPSGHVHLGSEPCSVCVAVSASSHEARSTAFAAARHDAVDADPPLQRETKQSQVQPKAKPPQKVILGEARRSFRRDEPLRLGFALISPAGPRAPPAIS